MKTMFRTLTLLAASAAWAAPAAAQEVTLKFHHIWNPQAMASVNVIQPWCDKIAKESGGKMKCQILPAMSGGGWALLLAVGLVLLVINPGVQYGLTRVAAGRAIVIFLFELVVAAFASWWLAGETMGAREWVGGGLIVAASLFSAKLEN